MKTIRTITDVYRLHSFEERYEYLRLDGMVGTATFGFDRYLNQRFYKSSAWRKVRDEVVVRDNGCDLGIPGREIHSGLLVHHINPISPEDLEDFNPDILDPEYLICVTHTTHNAIHFGSKNQLVTIPQERRPGDTKLW